MLGNEVNNFIMTIAKMEGEEALAINWLQIKKRKEEKKRKRMHWIYPVLADRSEKELFVTFYADLRANPDKFFLFARMSIYLLLMNLFQIPFMPNLCQSDKFQIPGLI